LSDCFDNPPAIGPGFSLVQPARSEIAKRW
jgi:hypothetical protein